MRFSIRGAAFVILLLAVDFVALKLAFTRYNFFRGFFAILALLPMVNILAVGAYVAANGKARAALIRFVVSGSIATLVLAGIFYAAPEVWLFRIDVGVRQNLRARGALKGLSDIYIFSCATSVAITATIFTPPLLLVAWMGSVGTRAAGRPPSQTRAGT